MKANRLRFIGLVLLVAGFVVAAGRAWRIQRRETDGSRVHLRLVHDMLHASVRKAFADAIVDYRQLHPEVDIDVIEVPSRMFRAWRTTRLVGDTAPDIMRLGDGISDDELARYFVPLTSIVAEPNPYNRGTVLAPTPWKDTFIDGLTGEECFSKALLDYYGVTLHFSTYRLFCNLDLLRKITGAEKLPTTREEFFDLCDTIKVWAAVNDPQLVPVAAYSESFNTFLMPLLRQQTQRLSVAMNLDRTLTLSKNQAALAWLRGDWNVDSPALVHGWETMRRVSQSLHPSFIQAQRDDSGFAFLQQQTVMIASGSYDASVFLNNPTFRCAVFRLAPPSPKMGENGQEVMGAIQENNVGGGAGAFGIMRSSPHAVQALDFLQYLSSYEPNRKFAATVQRIPAVVGVTMEPKLQAFAPQTEGWPEGIPPEFANWGNREVFRTLSVNLHHLVSTQGSVEEFVKALNPAYPAAIKRDLERVLQDSLQRSQRSDSVLIAYQRLGTLGNPAAALRVSQMFESQAVTEGEQAQLRQASALRDWRVVSGP